MLDSDDRKCLSFPVLPYHFAAQRGLKGQKGQIAVLKNPEWAQAKKSCSCPLRACWNLIRQARTQGGGQAANPWREQCLFLPKADSGLLLPSPGLGCRDGNGDDCSGAAPAAMETGSHYRWSSAMLDQPCMVNTPPQHAPKIQLFCGML